jgi:EmrB/QacA subfamily drug resistance transporter
MSSRRRPLAVLAAMSVMSALIWMPTAAVPIALPTIHADLGSSFSELQWMINAYTLAVAALLVTMGRIGDLLGRRRLFLAGCAVFSVGAASAALADETGWLIASLALIGVGAAMTGPTSLALVADAFPPDRQGWAIGIWGAASGIGSSLGPLIGGGLTAIGWQAVFWADLPLVAFAFALAAWATRESRAQERTALDTPGALTFGAGLTALILAVGQGAIWGWDSLAVLALLAAALVLLVSFVVVELRVASPLLPLRAFARRGFVIAEAVLLIGNVVLASLLFVLPLYLQNIAGHTALAAGVILLPATATLMVLSPVSGVLTDRLGPRAPMLAGILCSAIGVFLLSTIDAGSSVAALIPGLLVIGVAFGLQITPVNVVAVQSVPALRRATAAGVLLTTGMVGATLGIAAFGATFGSLARSELPTQLGDAGVHVSEADVETLDTVVTGSARARDVLGEFPRHREASIEAAVDDSFVSSLTSVLKGLAVVQLLAAAFALRLPGRGAGPPPVPRGQSAERA